MVFKMKTAISPALSVNSTSPETLRLKHAVQDLYHQDETASIEGHLARLTLADKDKARIKARARELIEQVRNNRRAFGGVDKFLNEFGLTTREGIALMCLAEALLRIPDSETADLLIRDKIGSAAWEQHLGKADDLFVNASTWALMLTVKVIADVDADEAKDSSIAGFAGKLVSKLGEPVVRQAMLHAMKIMGQQFVMGRTIDEALTRAVDSEKEGYRYSYDMLGEGARTAEDAERYFKNYEMAIDRIGKAAAGRSIHDAPNISVKLSALHPRYEYAHRHLAIPALTKKLLVLAQKCAHYNIGLTVDAEEAHRLEISMEIIEAVFTNDSLKNWDGFGLAIQAYHKRCYALIEWLASLAADTNRRMMVRLVKGAYWDSEIKYAQVNGLPAYPVYTRKAATDVSYLACAQKLLAERAWIYPMFATHNAYSVASILELAGSDQSGFEFQRLHGMGDGLYHQLVGRDNGKYPCRVYAPVGSHQDLLPYLVRRLLENGANTNFVNRLQNDKVPVDEMLVDPVDYMQGLAQKPHPKIPLPRNMFADRANSAGVEFAHTPVSQPLMEKIATYCANSHNAAPLISGKAVEGEKIKVLDPADTRRAVGSVVMATASDMTRALDVTHTAFDAWTLTPANTRADILSRTADLMEEHMAELMALCVREAGKTLPDALAEVREAVDFCRYYAVEGRKHFGHGLTLPGPTGESNQLFLEGRGVFLCISPWNFPLAIFIGQIAAALMAGNTVIAKPAEQTALIAHYAVNLLFKAGLPPEAIAFLPADGALAGKTLLGDSRIAGVAFTGSTEVARLINRALAARDGAIVPLIAETGGQNAMIVDSSALPEQVVDDAITSSFRSAGQRCSALRVLYVADTIADKVIDMLAGAAREVTVGDPLMLETDIGPVIDCDALAILNTHAERMDKQARKVAQVHVESDLTQHGHFFAPRAYEIKNINDIGREVFGPILHIIRFKPENIDSVIDEINGAGYGLTFGVHSRIDHTVAKTCARIKTGNCYINRSMIGAVVGVQPFGGQGLSGTGPKAGGPHYLMRFATERTVTNNTTASGGNTTLVSLAED